MRTTTASQLLLENQTKTNKMPPARRAVRASWPGVRVENAGATKRVANAGTQIPPLTPCAFGTIHRYSTYDCDLSTILHYFSATQKLGSQKSTSSGYSFRKVNQRHRRLEFVCFIQSSRMPSSVRIGKALLLMKKPPRGGFSFVLAHHRSGIERALRTCAWDKPNCRPIRRGGTPALNAAWTAFIWPRVNAAA
jgi:hypothetical protein